MACLECGGFGLVNKSEPATDYVGHYRIETSIDHEFHCSCPAGGMLDWLDAEKRAATVAPVTTW